jgi:hypothetical protein
MGCIMPRGPRLDAPGSLHHVIARGLERRRFFVDDRLTGGDPYQKYHRPYCGHSSGQLNSPTAPGSVINIDPNAHPTIQVEREFLGFRWQSTQPASTTRILAHEFGHAVYGTLDAGPGNLANVLLNENPIVNGYSSPTLRFWGIGDFPRIAY